MSRLKPEQIIAILEAAGHQALYVGGFVRDHLLGVQPDDADIATSACPDQVVELFHDRAEVKQQGKHFGVVVVDHIEVAMFRGESYTIPGKPNVFPAGNFAEDASRRDFTINAMGMTSSGQIIDPAGGTADLQARLIRAVGDPDTRFREDPARLLRAVTFAARLGFQIEEGTAMAIKKDADLLASLPIERVQKELIKMLDRYVLHRGLVLLRDLDLLPYVFPGWPAADVLELERRWAMVVATVKQAEQLHAPRAVVFAGMAAGCADDNVCIDQLPNMVLRLGFGRLLAKRVESLLSLSRPMDKLICNPHTVVDWLREVAAACRSLSEMKALVDELWQLRLARKGADRLLEGNKSDKKDLDLRYLIEAMLDQIPWYPSDAGIDGSSLGLKGAAVGLKIAELLDRAQIEALARLDLASKTDHSVRTIKTPLG